MHLAILKGTPHTLSRLQEMVDKAFNEYEKNTGLVDWTEGLENKERPNVSLDEIGKIFKNILLFLKKFQILERDNIE